MKVRRKRTQIWAYLDGKKLVEVIQAALDNNMPVMLTLRSLPASTKHETY